MFLKKLVPIAIGSFLFFSSFSSEETANESPDCLFNSLMIYDAGIAHHGDRERAIENAVAYFDFCIEQEELFDN